MNWQNQIFVYEGANYAVPVSAVLTAEEADTLTLNSVPTDARLLGTDAKLSTTLLAVLIGLGLGANVKVELTDIGVAVVNPRGEGMEGPGPLDLWKTGTDLRARVLAGIPQHAKYVLEAPAVHGESAFKSLLDAAGVVPTDEEQSFIDGLLTNGERFTQAWDGVTPNEWRRVTLRNDGCYKVITLGEVDSILQAKVDDRVSELISEMPAEAAAYFNQDLAKGQMLEEARSNPDSYLSPAYNETHTVVVGGVDLVLIRI